MFRLTSHLQARIIFVCNVTVLISRTSTVTLQTNIQGGTRNVIPLIVHITHFYYYKNI